jgi:hypothetical protein
MAVLSAVDMSAKRLLGIHPDSDLNMGFYVYKLQLVLSLTRQLNSNFVR